MSFGSPMLLLALLPWGALALWLLWFNRQTTGVPFLDLWRSAEQAPRTSRRFHPPPLALAAALLAALLAILGGAAPRVHVPWFAGPLVTVILDRGITMSADDRRAQSVALANDALIRHFGLGPTDFIAIPVGRIDHTNRSAWPRLARDLPSTALDSLAALRAAVAQSLARNESPVIVLSDQAIDTSNPRVVQIAPDKPLRNVGIVHVSVREHPHPQAMVTIRNDSDEIAARLLVTSADRSVEQPVQLPARGAERNYFLDLAALGPTVETSLAVQDELVLDNRYWLAGEPGGARIELRGDIAPEIGRVVRAYERSHAPADDAPRVAIVTAPDGLRDDESGVILASDGSGAATRTSRAALQIRPHPLTTNVHWEDLQLSAADESRLGVGDLRGGGWTALITDQDQILLAVRDAPARQVYVNFTAPGFVQRTDFVIFWTNVFDHLAAATAPGYSASTVAALAEEWKPIDTAPLLPGLYRRGDGAIRALNAPPVRIAPPAASDWRAKLALGREKTRRLSLAPAALLASLGCLSIALARWPRRNLTAFSAARTV